MESRTREFRGLKVQALRLRGWLRSWWILCRILFRGLQAAGRGIEIGDEAVGFFGELEAFDVGDAYGFGGARSTTTSSSCGGFLLSDLSVFAFSTAACLG